MTVTQTDNAGGQQDSTDPSAAGRPAPDSTNPTDPPGGEPTDADDQHADDDAQPDDGRSGREKRYRLRLREAERERDELRDTLERTRQSVVDAAVRAAGVDPRLMVAAGHTVETLVGDDGLIDHEALAAAVADTAREFRVPPKGRPPAPNQQQGHTSGHPGGKPSWAGALKGDSTLGCCGWMRVAATATTRPRGAHRL